MRGGILDGADRRLQPRGRLLVLWFACACALLTLGGFVGSRSASVTAAHSQQHVRRNRAAARAVLAQPSSCTNVASGRDLAVDNRGVLCARQSLMAGTGCCSDANLGQFVCESCEVDATTGSTCCLTFEGCISCCSAHASLDDCARRCRTSSKSLGEAWNRYRRGLTRPRRRARHCGPRSCVLLPRAAFPPT